MPSIRPGRFVLFWTRNRRGRGLSKFYIFSFSRSSIFPLEHRLERTPQNQSQEKQSKIGGREERTSLSSSSRQRESTRSSTITTNLQQPALHNPAPKSPAEVQKKDEGIKAVAVLQRLQEPANPANLPRSRKPISLSTSANSSKMAHPRRNKLLRLPEPTGGGTIFTDSPHAHAKKW